MCCHMTCWTSNSSVVPVLSCKISDQCVVMYCHMTSSVWEVIFCVCRIHQNSKRCKAYDTDLVSRGWLFYTPRAKWELVPSFCMLLMWDHGLDPPRSQCTASDKVLGCGLGTSVPPNGHSLEYISSLQGLHSGPRPQPAGVCTRSEISTKPRGNHRIWSPDLLPGSSCRYV